MSDIEKAPATGAQSALIDGIFGVLDTHSRDVPLAEMIPVLSYVLACAVVQTGGDAEGLVQTSTAHLAADVRRQCEAFAAQTAVKTATIN